MSLQLRLVLVAVDRTVRPAYKARCSKLGGITARAPFKRSNRLTHADGAVVERVGSRYSEAREVADHGHRHRHNGKSAKKPEAYDTVDLGMPGRIQ